jgi:hypothetical protein
MMYITYCNILLLSTGICAGKLAFCVGPRRVIGGEIFDVIEAITFPHAINPELFHSGPYAGRMANLHTHK